MYFIIDLAYNIILLRRYLINSVKYFTYLLISIELINELTIYKY